MKRRTSKKQIKLMIAVGSAALLAISLFSPITWLLVPSCVFFIFQQDKRWGQIAVLSMSFAALALSGSSPIFGHFYEVISWLMLLVGGALLFYGRKRIAHVLEWNCYLLAGAAVLILLWQAQVRFFQGPAALEELLRMQLESHSFPELFRSEAWEGEWAVLYRDYLGPFYRLTSLSWLVLSVAVTNLFNLLLVRLIDHLGRLRIRSSKYWRAFAEWRTPDYVLLPLVLGLGLLVFRYQHLFPESFDWLTWLGWNLSLLSLFPALMGGLAFFSWLLPRLSLLMSILVIFLLIYNAIPVLVIAGIADMWFDFRQKFREMIKKQEERADDDD